MDFLVLQWHLGWWRLRNAAHRKRFPHVGGPLRRHLPHLHRAEGVQKRPILPIDCPPVYQRFLRSHRDFRHEFLRLFAGSSHPETGGTQRAEAHAKHQRLAHPAIRREESLVVGDHCRIPCPSRNHPDLHGPADHGRYCEPKGEQTEEGMWLPSGSVHSLHSDCHLQHDGSALVSVFSMFHIDY